MTIDDEDTIHDLKQFITASMGQQATTLKQEIVQEVSQKIIQDLSQKIEESKEEILTAVADTLQTHIEATDERLDDHEKRLTRLEHKPA